MAFRGLFLCSLLMVSAISHALLQGSKVCIVGGGPCGLLISGLLLRDHDDIQVEVLEKSALHSNTRNAFGIGMNERIVQSLALLDPSLAETVLAKGARLPALDRTASDGSERFKFHVASRNNICEQMTNWLQERHAGRLRVSHQEACEQVDFGAQTITTSQGRLVHYDLLIAADGVNSNVRRTLVEQGLLQEEHYLDKRYWKCLEIPVQSLGPSFRTMQHPLFFGRILPRYPDGHLALIFWDPADNMDSFNPKGIETSTDLKEAMTLALSDNSAEKNNIRRLFGVKVTENDESPLQVEFDEQAVKQFLNTRPGQSHYLKVNQYHCGNTVLLGDAAHGMYSFLGQGCSCGMQNAHVLAGFLRNSRDVGTALARYSEVAVPAGHAITDLNLVSHILASRDVSVKLRIVPLLLWQALRGKLLMKRVGRSDVDYPQLLRENRHLVNIGRALWEKDRVEYAPPPGSAAASKTTTDISSL